MRRASGRGRTNTAPRGERKALPRSGTCYAGRRRASSAPAAERLAGLLAQMGDTRRLAEVGDWIIDCATGDDLIARFGNGAGSGR